MSSDFSFDDGDDAPTPHNPEAKRAAGGSSPVRFISPGTFGIAIVLFFLPWTDLSCNGPKGKIQLVTQSGLQSATGEASEGDGFARMREAEGIPGAKKADAKFDLDELKRNPFQREAAGKGNSDKTEKAYLLWVYLVLLIGGAVVPVLLAATRLRGTLILGFAGLALLLLGLQLLIGFPLGNAAADFNNEMKQIGDLGKNAVGPQINIGGKMEMKSSFLPAFFGSVLFLVMSVALGLLQLIVGGPKVARSGR